MYKLLILVLIAFAVSQRGPLVGDINQLNGVSTLGISTWDGKQHTGASQDFPASAALLNTYNSKGDIFYVKSSSSVSWIEYQNTTMRTHVGGRGGYLTGTVAGVVRGILATKTKLYVCGVFTQAGSLFVNQTSPSGGTLSGRIVEMDISNGVSISSTFSRVLPLFDDTKTGAGVDCSSTAMWNLNDVLIARESYGNAPLLSFASASPVAISYTTSNFSRIHVTQFENVTNYLYVLGANMMDNSGILPYIQKYSGSGATWAPIFPSKDIADGNALTVVIRQFIVAPNDVIYMTFIADVFGDVKENRNRYIYQAIGGTVKKVTPNARFSSSLGFGGVLNSNQFTLQWDPMLSTLMVWGDNVRAVIYGNEFQMLDQTIPNWYDGNTQAYGKMLTFYAYLANDTEWLQSFGGGVSFAASAPVAFHNGKAVIGADVGWNFHASKVAVWNSATSQYESFFAKGKGIDFDPLALATPKVNVFDDDFSMTNGGILGGSFRTIDNITCNSICMVSATGKPTPLAQKDATWADVGVRAFATTPGAFEYQAGTVNAMAHLSSSNYTYIGGAFRLAGNASVSNVARYNWKSMTWHDVSGGVDGTVNAMLRDNENLYVAGTFSNAGTIRTNNIAVFNTITEKWSALNFGLDGPVTKLFWYNGKVTAIGTFGSGSGSNTKGNLLKQIAQWDGKRWRGLVGGYGKAFTEADTCATNNFCTMNAAGNVKDASVVNGVLWVVTGDASNNVYSYDGSWVKYATPPTTFGGAVAALIIGQDNKPLFQMSSSIVGEWRVYDQGLDNFVVANYLTPGSIVAKSFGTVAQLNLLLIALATLLVFIQ